MLAPWVVIVSPDLIFDNGPMEKKPPFQSVVFLSGQCLEMVMVREVIMLGCVAGSNGLFSHVYALIFCCFKIQKIIFDNVSVWLDVLPGFRFQQMTKKRYTIIGKKKIMLHGEPYESVPHIYVCVCHFNFH